MAYKDLLRDPRWQRKRLEIFQRDEWTCVACGTKDKELQVHHGYYAKGLMPWEHPAATLHTVCPDCHLGWQGATSMIHAIIGSAQPSTLRIIIKAVLGSVSDVLESPSDGSLKFTKEDWAALVKEFGKATDWLGEVRAFTERDDE